MPTVRTLLADGAPAPLCALVLGAWVACMVGPRSADFEVGDAALGSLERRRDDDVEARAGTLLDLPGFLGRSHATERSFRADVVEHARRLWWGDLRAVLTDTVARAAVTRSISGGSS
jgi:hypothetical protein